jgi:hypothetical protein
MLQLREALKYHLNKEQVLYTRYYTRSIEGDRSVGSKAKLKCENGWKLMADTPDVQTCIEKDGALVWTKPGICVYCKSV